MEEVKVEESESKPSTSGSVQFPNENKYSHIKNKQVRVQQFQKAKKAAKKVLFNQIADCFLTYNFRLKKSKKPNVKEKAFQSKNHTQSKAFERKTKQPSKT